MEYRHIVLRLGDIKVPQVGQGHALHAKGQEQAQGRGANQADSAVHGPAESLIGREDPKIQDQDGQLDQVGKYAPEDDIHGSPLSMYI